MEIELSVPPRNMMRRSGRTAASAAALVLCLAFGTASAQTIDWTRQFGTRRNDTAQAVVSGPGGVYVAGRVNGALPGAVAKGGSDAFVRKYSANGKELWTRQFGTPERDAATAVASDATGIYVAGTTRGRLPGETANGLSDGFLRKYGPTGTLLWTRQFGTSNEDAVHGVAVSTAGVVVTGETLGIFEGESAHGLQDGFVLAFGADGAPKWSNQFGTTSSDDATAVAADGSRVYVSGATAGAFSGRQSRGGKDAFLRKYGAGGSLDWTRQFGTSSSDGASGVAVSTAGVFATGSTAGTFSHEASEGGGDAFVRRYGTNGSVGWTTQFGTNDRDDAMAIAAGAGGVQVAGATIGRFPGQTTVGHADAFLQRVTPSGDLGWVRQFGSAANDNATGVTLDAAGTFVSGKTKGEFTGQTSSGRSDAFAVRVS
jgi:hypothetical protein